MGKVLLFLSFIGTAILVAGAAFWPNNPVFWLASSAYVYQNIRILLLVIIAVQLLTKPPRSVIFRIIAGSIAIIIGAGAIAGTLKGHMLLLDTFAFLQAAFAIATVALETKSKPGSIQLGIPAPQRIATAS